jgi:AraC-like DNA-binding protein
MGHPFFFTGHERELGDLVDHPDCRPIERQLRGAACRGMDVDLFHPEDGQADDLVIARCAGCPARLACLALALRAEEPDARAGWYGGLGPEDRDLVAAALDLDVQEPPVPEGAVKAAQLKAAGWTVREIATALGCSRRTVQRYLRMTAA